MITRGRKKGTTRFILKPTNGVNKVCLAGDFTEWKPVRMRKQANGSYAITVPLSEGMHEYKFQVDEDWLLDPDNHQSTLNSFGTLNSVTEIY